MEDGRKALISLGLAQANYIAQNYMSEEIGKKYIAAMETVAKYAMNGVVSEDGIRARDYYTLLFSGLMVLITGVFLG